MITSPSFSTITLLTDASGFWSANVPLNASFQVCEDKTIAPLNSPLWEQTGPSNGATAGPDSEISASAGCWSGPADVASIGEDRKSVV